ncbi:MAG: response regulator [Candidatus Rokuibacteriota bacterium]
MRVLVVDDDMAMATLLRDTLERHRYRVIVAGGADQALDAVEADRPDAVLIDKEMPGMNGLDLLPLLRNRLPEVPLILMTAFGGQWVAAEAFARGADRYLEKPFRVSDLLAILGSLPSSS